MPTAKRQTVTALQTFPRAFARSVVLATEAIQQGFDSTIRTFTCFKDFEVNEKAFLKQINNPRNGGSEFLQDLSKSFINSLIF